MEDNVLANKKLSHRKKELVINQLIQSYVLSEADKRR